jgi:type I restriction enzyme S subunit
MARRLFDEWFVHFRFPGHEAHTIIETEHGRLPRDWTWAPLDSFLILQRGFDLPSSARQAGHVPVMTGSGVSGYHNEAKVVAPGIVTGRSGTVGNIFLVSEDFWPLNTALYIREFKKSTPIHALYLLRSVNLASRAVGSAVPTLTQLLQFYCAIY